MHARLRQRQADKEKCCKGCCTRSCLYALLRCIRMHARARAHIHTGRLPGRLPFAFHLALTSCLLTAIFSTVYHMTLTKITSTLDAGDPTSAPSHISTHPHPHTLRPPPPTPQDLRQSRLLTTHMLAARQHTSFARAHPGIDATASLSQR
jgi:hypothetical protein